MERSRAWRRQPVLACALAVLGLAGCGYGELEGRVGEEADGHAPTAPVETELLYVMDEEDARERFVDGVAIFRPERPFRSVAVMSTGEDLEMSYALVEDEEQGPWHTLELERHDVSFARGVAGSEGGEVDAIALRVDAGELAFARLAFSPELLERADTHDDLHGHDHEAQPNALSQAGRWALPSQTRQAGERQYVSYTGAGSRCSGSLTPGARELGRFLVANFPGARYYQGYNCRRIRGGSGLSMHAVGRAVDVFIPLHRGQADNDLGDPVGNYLVANAERLGIQFVIWDRTKWNGSYSGRKDRYYGGAHPHHDHLHIELTPHAARGGLSFPPVGEAPGPFTPYFADDDDSPHEAAINALHESGLVSGCRGGERPRFCPSAPLTRGQLSAILARGLSLPPSPRDHFGDDHGSPFEDAINRVAHAGISHGCGSDRFCPDETVTRGAMAKFLARGLGLPDSAYDFFEDDDGRYYEGAANSLRIAGISHGCAEGRFCGARALDRAEAAQLLARAFGLVPTLHRPFFEDDDGNIHEDAINKLYAAGITRGCGVRDGQLRYCPDRAVTRAQFATMLVRGAEIAASARDFFTDDDDSVHEASINAMAAAGITRGCGAERFCPSDEVRRKHLAVFFARAFALPPASQDHFDDDDGQSWEDAANRLAEAGITRGCGRARRFCGDEPVTRDQLATFFVRALGL